MKRGLRRWVWVLVLAVAAGVAYGGWRLARAWRYRTALVEIRKLVQAGRHGLAAQNLAAVLAWEPGSDEAAYLLGLCEKARGRTRAADEAWVRVPPDSRFAPPAIVGRAAMLVDRGRVRRRRAAAHPSTERSSDRWVRAAPIPDAALLAGGAGRGGAAVGRGQLGGAEPVGPGRFGPGHRAGPAAHRHGRGDGLRRVGPGLPGSRRAARPGG